MDHEQFYLKLFIDPERKVVVSAESDYAFVDCLLSFLTLPLGTVVRLAGKQSRVGSMDSLYQSVESLDDKYLHTEECRNMLLRPRNASEEKCANLLVNIDDTGLTKYSICPTWSCCTETNRFFSMVPKTKCICGKVMDRGLVKKNSNLYDYEEGVFVKSSGGKFTIADDLQVKPLSAANEQGRTKQGIVVEERNLDFGYGEVLELLKCSLNSKTALTDVFVSKRDDFDPADFHIGDNIASSLPERERDHSKTSVKFLVSKSSKKVLYAEAREDFMDFLLSFLTFPVGSIVKLLGGKSSLGCIDNLYSSVEELSASGHTTSKDIKTLLLCPKLAPYLGCANQLLEMEEALPWNPSITKCYTCFMDRKDPAYGRCSHGLGRTQLLAMNPKFPDAVTHSGGGFVKREAMFMVTDELAMIPHSPIAIVKLINELDLQVSDLEEQVVRFGKEEALTLMKAFLFCRTPFSNFISHRNEKVKMKAAAAYVLSGFCTNSRPTTNTLNTILKAVGKEEDDDKLEKLIAEFEEKGIKDFISSLKETFSPTPNSDRNANISAVDSLRDPDTETSKTPKRSRTNYRG